MTIIQTIKYIVRYIGYVLFIKPYLKMSRNVLSIKDLSSGINTEFDPGDIKETEATVLENISVDRLGKMVPTFGYRNFPIANTDGYATHYNEGVFSFRSDYNIEGEAVGPGWNYIISHIAGTPQKIRIARYDAIFNSSYKEFDVENGTYRFIYHDNVVVAYDYSEDGIENKRRYIFRGANSWEKETVDGGNKAIVGSIVSHWGTPWSVSTSIEYVGDITVDNNEVSAVSYSFLEALYLEANSWNLPQSINHASNGGNLTYWSLLRGNIIDNQIPHVNDDEDGRGWRFDVSRQTNPVCANYIGQVNTAINEETPFSSAFNLTVISSNALEDIIVHSFNVDVPGGPYPAILGGVGSSSKNVQGRIRFKASRILPDGTESALSEEELVANYDVSRPLHIATFNMLKSFRTFDFFQNSRGIKLYYRSDTSNAWEYLLKIEESKDVVGEYRAFLNDGEELKIDVIGGTHLSEDWEVLSIQNIHTVDLGLSYEVETGYNASDSISAGFKYGLVVNNRMFALNIYQGGLRHPDRILVSPLRNIFALPDNNTLDVGMGDGEAFICAVHFKGLLFAFKSNTLYVINVSSNDPSTFYVQSTHPGIRVESPNAVCLSEFGVYFADINGVYFHNGENLSNITYGRLHKEWTGINGLGARIYLGYSRRDKMITIIGGLPAFRKIYIYSLKTDSFVTTNSLTTNPGLGNEKPFIHMNNELLIRWDVMKYFYTESFYKPDNAKIVTAFYGIGDSSVRKKVRRFYVTLNPGIVENVTNDHINLRYRVDDGEFTSTTFEKQAETLIMFDLPLSALFRRIQIEVTLSKHNDQMIDSINEISMVYRTKMPK